MWPFKGTYRMRRLESRRREAPAEGSRWRRFRAAGGLGALLIAAGFYAAVVAINVWPIDPMTYHYEKQYVPHDIYARVRFQVVSDEKKITEENKVRDSTAEVFRLDDKESSAAIAGLQSLPDIVGATTAPASGPESQPSKEAAAWKAVHEGQARKEYERRVQELGKKLAQTPLVDESQYDAQVKVHRLSEQVTLIGEGGKSVTVDKTKLLNAGDAAQVGQLLGGFDPAIQQEMIKQLQAHPPYQYDQAASNNAVADALEHFKANLPSAVYEAYARGDKIVPADSHLTAGQVDLLHKERDEYEKSLQADHPLWKLWLGVGRAGTVLVIFLLLAAFTLRNDTELVLNHYLGFAATAMMLAALVVIRAAMNWQYAEAVAVLMVIMATVVLTIARSQRFALTAGLILSLLAVYQLRGDLGQFVVLLAGVSSAVLPLKEIRSRSRLIEIGAFLRGGGVRDGLRGVGGGHGAPSRHDAPGGARGAGGDAGGVPRSGPAAAGGAGIPRGHQHDAAGVVRRDQAAAEAPFGRGAGHVQPFAATGHDVRGRRRDHRRRGLLRGPGPTTTTSARSPNRNISSRTRGR